MDRYHSYKGEASEIFGVRGEGKPCVWMEAGLVNERMCDRHYDCHHCPFDRAMRSAMDAQDPPKGRHRESGRGDGMRKKYPGHYKPCRYLLNRNIGPPGMCLRNYDCDGCPIEVFFEYESQPRKFLESTPRIRSRRDAEQSIQI